MKPLVRLSVILFLVINISFSLSFFSTWHTSASEVSEQLYIRSNAVFTNTPAVWVFAEVINNSTMAVRNVNVTITFYDNQSRVIEALTYKVWLEVILPHRRAPVAASIGGSNECSRFARYEAKIDEGYEWDPEGKEASLIIYNAGAYLGAENTTVVGYISNNGSRSITVIEAIGIFYDQKGIRAAETDYFVLSTPLAPGAATDEPFIIQSAFVNNASDWVVCILTVESPDIKTQKGYAADQEVLLVLKGTHTVYQPINSDGQLFDVAVETNSSIPGVSFSKEDKRLNFTIVMTPTVAGFCNVTIPIKLLGGPYTVKTDGAVILNDYIPPTNETHAFIYFTYNQTVQTVEIIGTSTFQNNEGKFDFRIIALIIICLSAAIIVVVARKKTHRKPHRRPTVNSQRLRLLHLTKPTNFYFYVHQIV